MRFCGRLAEPVSGHEQKRDVNDVLIRRGWQLCGGREFTEGRARNGGPRFFFNDIRTEDLQKVAIEGRCEFIAIEKGQRAGGRADGGFTTW